MPKNLPPWLLTVTNEGDGGGSAPESSESGIDAGGSPGKGYPDATRVEDMTPEEQAAYWKSHSRKHENRLKAMGDYEELKSKAAALDELEDSLKTQHELDVEKAHAAGRQSALRDANEGAARAIFEASLRAREVPDEKLATHLRHFSPATFLTDDGVDAEELVTYVNSIAGTVASDQLDMGQGNRGKGNTIRSGEELLKQFKL